MTTTAFDDQFTVAPEPVRQPYDTGSILRRNVADLELALKQQTERAEAAEAELLAVRDDNHSMMLEIDGLRKELAKLREQKLVAMISKNDAGQISIKNPDGSFFDISKNVGCQFYAAPVPAVAAPAVPDGDDFNGSTPHLIQCMEALVRLDADGVLVPHGIGRDASKLLSAAANRLRQQAASSVPEEWREVMAELAADLQASIEAEHAYRDQYSSVMRKYQNDMRIVEQARSLLQSAEGYSSQAQNEVRHD